jgi:3-oxoacyl-[acyl-carrier protein] reductase
MSGAARMALVTGASGGLGRAVAVRLAAAGLDVVLTGRSREALDATAAEVRATASERTVHVLTCDLAVEDEVRSLVARLAAQRARPDVLVNNAAVQGPIGPFLSAEWRAWSATIAVDLLAPARLTQALLPDMIARGWGRVINVSGGGATGPRPDFSAYAVAKTGLVRFTETLAHELTGSGVTVNAVAPGPMNTRMLDEVLDAGPARAPREHAAAVRRAQDGGVSPDAAARLVAWLASDASAAVTGRLVSALWDPWERLAAHSADLDGSDIYTLRRIVPRDRGLGWGDR